MLRQSLVLYDTPLEQYRSNPHQSAQSCSRIQIHSSHSCPRRAWCTARARNGGPWKGAADRRRRFEGDRTRAERRHTDTGTGCGDSTRGC